jgi:hypothetical protein
MLNETPAATRVPSLIGLLNGPRNTSGATNTVSAGLSVAPEGSAVVPPRYAVRLHLRVEREGEAQRRQQEIK